MINSQWQSRRSDFNHQWLSNCFLTQLRPWVARMKRAEEDLDELWDDSFASTTLRQWKYGSTEARWIVDHAIESLSPKRLFDQVPLCQIPMDIRIPVAEGCHFLWLEKTLSVRERVVKAKDDVDLRYDELVEALDVLAAAITSSNAKRVSIRATKFCSACNELHDALDKLPACANW